MENIEMIRQTASDLLAARVSGASRILTFGYDLIHNGLGPQIGQMISDGLITHLATTGMSVVEDWNIARGRDDGDRYVNLAVMVGNLSGLGFGEAVSKVIADGCLDIPEPAALMENIASGEPELVAASAELLHMIVAQGLATGHICLDFPGREKSLMYMAAKAGIPFTVHPQFGLDDLFTDKFCSFAAIGRAAEKDFLGFVASVYELEGGVYLSVGSSVASPMIFEKALSMSQNVRIQRGCRMTHHKIVVVDLAESRWDWMKNGEPPETRPEYYLRYCKSFSRANAESMYYICSDNRDFFAELSSAVAGL